MMEVMLKTYSNDEMAYEYEIVKDYDGTYFIYASHRAFNGKMIDKELPNLETAMRQLFNAMTREEGWGKT